MECSISGTVPEEPVVSKNSGLIFERRLIERHIADFGKCPVTGEPLIVDEIVPLRSAKIVKPRAVQTASIPGILAMFQNEWDGLMLSNFALEQQLHTARQELSHALFQLAFLGQDIIATGGFDSTAVLFDRPSGQIISTLGGHSKRVTSMKFVGDSDLFLTGSADKYLFVQWRRQFVCGNNLVMGTMIVDIF